jgi:hypothetical protein
MEFSLFGLLAKVLLERRVQSPPAAIFDDRVKSIEWPFSPSNGSPTSRVILPRKPRPGFPGSRHRRNWEKDKISPLMNADKRSSEKIATISAPPIPPFLCVLKMLLLLFSAPPWWILFLIRVHPP